METQIARGYIKKTRSIKNDKSIVNRFAAYKGILNIDSKKIIVEVYSDNEDFKSDEIFIKLSADIPDISNML